MNNTKLLLLGLSTAGIAILAGLGYQHIYSQNDQDTSIPTQSQETALTLPVSAYLELLPQSGPPNINQEAVASMVNLLSESAQAGLRQPHSAGLAMFAGIQDLPDQGTNITSVNMVSDTTAQVETVWNYSGAVSSKTFNLVFEAGTWKIDSIK